MGAGSSTPAPPPRLAKMLTVSLAGDPDPIPSTIRLMDLPPATTQTAREGIALCAGLRRHYIYSATSKAEESVVEKTVALLDNLIQAAKKACNIRDYVTLLIELTVLRLSMDLGPPTEELVEVARFVNPFLHHAGSGGGSSEVEGSRMTLAPFRTTDTALITDIEKDLLVLLYYCHVENIKGSPDEAIGHLGRMAEKFGVISDLKTRKEPFLETEVYLFWSLTFLTHNLTTTSPSLTPASQTTLKAEQAITLSRLLTVCDMLVSLDNNGRLDQACFLLMFLRRLAAREDSGWWKSKAKHLGRDIMKSRPGRQKWHCEFAERTVRALAKGKGSADGDDDDGDGWEGRNSLSFSRENLGIGVDLWNGS